jgi:glycosyltransferase involved in cell wall biosynthesis
MKELISIIVPVYNAQNYIEKCVNSIISQSYKNIEIILVDDGSTDRSPLILDNYAKLDSRIRVIHKTNGGVSDTRNCGLDAAKGDYIGFIDADDWVDVKMYENLHNYLSIHEADISCCSYYNEFENYTTKTINFRKDRIFNRNESLTNFLEGSFGRAVWNKLFRKSILKHRFDTGMSVGEDSYFFYQAIKNSDKMVFISKPLYHYVLRSGSATHVKLNESKFDTLTSANIIYNDIVKIDNKYKNRAKYMVFKRYFAILNMILFYDYENQFEHQMADVIRELDHLVKGLKTEKVNEFFRVSAYKLFGINRTLYKKVVKQYYRNKYIS